MDEFWSTCPVCGNLGTFKRFNQRTRETFPCERCRAILRYQAQAYALVQVYGRGSAASLVALASRDWFRELDVYEPGVMGPYREILRDHPNYVNSFYWDDVPPGEMKDGIQCQDLHKTTFPDNAFDLIITSDIFEHIRKPFAAFREIRRILKRGGYHIFSIPLTINMPKKTVSRVDTENSEDVNILPPVYHGNGIGGQSLVYTDFGADLFEYLANMGLPTTLSFYRPTDSLPPQLTLISAKI